MQKPWGWPLRRMLTALWYGREQLRPAETRWSRTETWACPLRLLVWSRGEGARCPATFTCI